MKTKENTKKTKDIQSVSDYYNQLLLKREELKKLIANNSKKTRK